MRRQVEAELARLKAIRDRHASSVREIDLEIGRVATEAISDDEYTSKSSIGRVLGVSHTQVNNLMISYSQVDPKHEPQTGIPIFENSLASKYVVERGTRIKRSISAFDPSDALFRSGLDPRLFNDDGQVRSPAMLWQLATGEWIGVDQVSVGYGGTGCGYARNALVDAGVRKDLADRIVSWRFCDAVDVDIPESWQESRIWPVEARGVSRILDDRIILDIGERLDQIRDFRNYTPPQQDPIDESGFYPSISQMGLLEAWITFLDQPQLPDWAQGPRVARVFLTDEEAETQGFVLRANDWGISRGRVSIPVVVLEQGHLQIWGHFYRPHNRTELLPVEAHEMLSDAGVYSAELEQLAKTSDNPISRFFTDLFGTSKTLPPSVDVSATGSDHLSYTPGLDAEQQTER